MKTVVRNYKAMFWRSIRSIESAAKPLFQWILMSVMIVLMGVVWVGISYFTHEHQYVVIVLDALWMMIFVFIVQKKRCHPLVILSFFIVSVLIVLTLLGALWNILVFIFIVFPLSCMCVSALSR